jgi:hypothetical protein
MHFKSVFAVFALTASSAVLAAPALFDRLPKDCQYGYDWDKKQCNDEPHCEYGYDEHVRTSSSYAPKILIRKQKKQCKEKPYCEYGYDEHVCISTSSFALRS